MEKEESYKFKVWKLFTRNIIKEGFGNFLSFEKVAPWKLAPRGVPCCYAEV